MVKVEMQSAARRKRSELVGCVGEEASRAEQGGTAENRGCVTIFSAAFGDISRRFSIVFSSSLLRRGTVTAISTGRPGGTYRRAPGCCTVSVGHPAEPRAAMDGLGGNGLTWIGCNGTQAIGFLVTIARLAQSRRVTYNLVLQGPNALSRSGWFSTFPTSSSASETNTPDGIVSYASLMANHKQMLPFVCPVCPFRLRISSLLLRRIVHHKARVPHFVPTGRCLALARSLECQTGRYRSV